MAENKPVDVQVADKPGARKRSGAIRPAPGAGLATPIPMPSPTPPMPTTPPVTETAGATPLPPAALVAADALVAPIGEALDAAASATPAPAPAPAQPGTAVAAAARPPVPPAAPDPAALDPAALEPANMMPANPIETLRKGFKTMSDTFTTATPFAITPEKAQAMFGDLNARAKTAAEKGAKLVEGMSEFAKGNVEALVESSKLAAKAAETLGQESADYGKKSLETATSAFKSFATVKSPTELFQLQSEFAKSSFDSAVAEASKMSEMVVKLYGDMFQPISSRFAVAAEKVKTASL